MRSNTPRTMPPIFSPSAPEAQQMAEEKAITQYLDQFYSASILQGIEVQTVAHLSRIKGETNEKALLGAALAIRAPRHGHICLDLSTAENNLKALAFAGDLNEKEPQAAISLNWPPLKDWIDALAKSPLVRTIAPREKNKVVRSADTQNITPFVLDGHYLYTQRYWYYQKHLAEALLERANSPLFEVPDPEIFRQVVSKLFGQADDSQNLIDRQQLSVAMALLRTLTVISGGPGTGKTWTVRNILAILYLQREIERKKNGTLSPLRVALAAPSGKAAARMQESIVHDFKNFAERLQESLDHHSLAKSISVGTPLLAEKIADFLKRELQSFTLHRLLGYQTRTPTRFRHHRSNPLRYDVVVIDEASMVDVGMMARVLDAVAPKSRLILLGDRRQLSSVEAGTILADICGPSSNENMQMSSDFVNAVQKLCYRSVDQSIQSKNHVPPISNCIVHYNVNHRFKSHSGIGQFAKYCREMDAAIQPDTATVTDLFSQSSQNLAFKNSDEGTLSKEVEKIIVKGFKPYLEMLLKGPKDSDEKQFHQDLLAQFDQFRILSPHRRGRLGVNGLNQQVEILLDQALDQLGKNKLSLGINQFYIGRPILIRQNDYEQNLFNGDVGIVVDSKMVTSKPGHSKRVVFPDPVQGVRYISTSKLPPKHQTVFAMTIHSAQGSEFGHAMVVLPKKISPLITREMIYTGVTRGKERMTMVGNQKILEKGLVAKIQRASGLKQLLWEL